MTLRCVTGVNTGFFTKLLPMRGPGVDLHASQGYERGTVPLGTSVPGGKRI